MLQNIGDTAIERVLNNVNATINWMESHYRYAGPNGTRITEYDDFEKVMSPRDWEVYSFLNSLECKLHI
jgi:D-mannonate dehydratase